MAPISTPCTGICRLDRASGLCLGCGRTGDEIARWRMLSEVERLAIMDGLEARRLAAGLPAQPAPGGDGTVRSA